ncbi:MAG: DUF4139 domain-containing protein [Vicinamibacteria bacterium]|nr:DUF4139 domain-containing protein [Vicinamibacteria bacterium]
MTRKQATAVLLAASQATFAGQVTSTGDNRVSVAVTVYNDGRGLVREERSIDLSTGVNEVRFMDVAEQIQAPTVRVAPIEGAPFNVLEQNYEYDLLSPAKLLDKYVGRTITLVQQKMMNNSTVEEPVEAKLLSNNNGTVWEIGGKIVVNPPYSRMIFPGIPEGLIARPTLVWQIGAPAAGKRKIEASYITGGMQWSADYVLSLDAAEEKAGLQGWVTVNNNSGASYKDAKLKLVAGDVHKAAPPMQFLEQRQRLDMPMAAGALAFQEEGLFEYHLYTLDRPSTLKNAQTKQIQLLQAEGIRITKDYVLNGGTQYFQSVFSGPPSKEKIAVFIGFRNSETTAGLGQPMPKGIIRVFKKDRSGSPQLIGEDNIDHTPRNEEVKLELGNAFDIVAERRQTDFKNIGGRPGALYESAHEIRIRNQKDTPVTVRVVEPLGGEWTMVETSLPNRKTAAFESQWDVPVPAGGETVLTYRVRVKY